MIKYVACCQHKRIEGLLVEMYIWRVLMLYGHLFTKTVIFICGLSLSVFAKSFLLSVSLSLNFVYIGNIVVNLGRDSQNVVNMK